MNENERLYNEIKARAEALDAHQREFNQFLFGDRHDSEKSIALDPEIIVPNLDEFVITPTGCKLDRPNTFDDDVLARWHTADIPVTVGAGVLGALASWALRDVFNSWHEKWNAKKTLEGGHGGENIDWVSGSAGPGGGKHRFKFGHDLLNPFEVDWDQYIELAKQSKTILPKWLKAGFYWLRHLYQDTFSFEGLPLPGHSLLRGLIDPTPEQIKAFMTIKARDVVGTALTNAILIGYLWGTEGGFRRVFGRENFRVYTILMAGNFVNLASGLFIPPPATTLNWATIPIIARYLWKLYRLNGKVRKALDEREATYDANDLKIEECFKMVASNKSELDKMFAEVKRYHDEVECYRKQTDDSQEKLIASFYTKFQKGAK